MFSEHDSDAQVIFCASSLESVANRRQRRLALMRELRTSLEGSHQALLALDLAGIQQGTRAQIELGRRLAEEIRQVCPCREQQPEEELRGIEWEVLQALRVQDALLERLRGKLRVLANMLAEPGSNYGPLLEGSGMLYGFSFKSGFDRSLQTGVRRLPERLTPALHLHESGKSADGCRA
jgi:hypothetical protein